jgi:hypothetical protein
MLDLGAATRTCNKIALLISNDDPCPPPFFLWGGGQLLRMSIGYPNSYPYCSYCDAAATADEWQQLLQVMMMHAATRHAARADLLPSGYCPQEGRSRSLHEP